MRNFTSLCFTADGLINPQAIDFYRTRKLEKLIVVSDGSREAYRHIRNFNFHEVVDKVSELVAARTPSLEMRVRNQDNTLSFPHYLFDKDKKLNWFCQTICLPVVYIRVSDMTQTNSTEFEMDDDLVVSTCMMAFTLWSMCKVAEDHLAFPAVVINNFIDHSRLLRDPCLTTSKLQETTGLSTLNYDEGSDTLSVTVGGDTFTVKRSVLDDFLTEKVLPFFNKFKGRRYRLSVCITGLGESDRTFRLMTYGELGRYLHLLQEIVVEKHITSENPIPKEDLSEYGKHIVLSPLSCSYPSTDQSIADFIVSNESVWLRSDETSNDSTLDSEPQPVTILSTAV